MRVLPAMLTVVVPTALLLAACGQVPSGTSGATGASSSTAQAPSSGETEQSLAPGQCRYQVTDSPARPVAPPAASGVPTTGTLTYVLKMTAGDVRITMDRAKAPCTVNSFVSLADQGYFDQTKCHRLADSGIFILQCGDPTGTGTGGPGYVFDHETTGDENYARGVVAMANAGPGTNGSQFFLVWDDSTSLNKIPNYTIFGQLDPASRDVVATMAGEGQDGSNPDGSGRPNNPSEIISVKRG